MSDSPGRRSVAVAAAIDLVSVVAFVAIGRKSHAESGSAITGTAKVAAPFLIALVVGWVAARAWKSPMAVGSGVVIWLCTVVVGMLLRRFAFDRGTALPFIIVASLFTLLFLVGWRLLAEWRADRSHVD
ncbi:MAG: DUF3054 domain-containing protein [Ilumatobacteraceae bacterium]